jgi:hypothetical protein
MNRAVATLAKRAALAAGPQVREFIILFDGDEYIFYRGNSGYNDINGDREAGNQ